MKSTFCVTVWESKTNKTAPLKYFPCVNILQAKRIYDSEKTSSIAQLVELCECKDFEDAIIASKEYTAKTRTSRNKAVEKYDKANTKGYYIKLNKKTDKALIEYLDKVDNRQGLIKELLQNHINNLQG